MPFVVFLVLALGVGLVVVLPAVPDRSVARSLPIIDFELEGVVRSGSTTYDNDVEKRPRSLQ